MAARPKILQALELHAKNTFLITFCGIVYFYLIICFLTNPPDHSFWSFSRYVEFVQPENDPILKAKTVRQRCSLTSSKTFDKLGIKPPYDPNLRDPLNWSELSSYQKAKMGQGIVLSYLTRQNRYFNLSLNKKKVMACIPPKTGSSNWQQVFAEMMKDSLSEQDLKHAVPGDNRLYQILPRIRMPVLAAQHKTSINRTNPANKITQFFDVSFTSSRHPLTRLVSAFHSKFPAIAVHTEESPNYFIRDYLPLIKNNWEKGYFIEPDMQISFEAFVNFILYQNCGPLTDRTNDGVAKLVKKCDAHWVPYSYYCQVCVQEYDAITNTEELEFGARKIFSHIMNESPIGKDILPGRYTTTTQYNHNSPEYLRKNYFDKLTDKVKRDLLQFYYWDFTLYGYSFEEYMTIF